VRRDNGVKEDIPRGSLVEHVKELLEKIQQNMYEVAKQKREACVQEVKTWDEFIKALNEKKLILAPWCDEEVCYSKNFLFQLIELKLKKITILSSLNLNSL